MDKQKYHQQLCCLQLASDVLISPFAYRTALILHATDSTRYWKQVRVAQLQILSSGHLGGHLGTVNTQFEFEMI